MDEKTKKALERVIAYLWDDERKDYLGDKRGGHIYLSLRRVNKWLDEQE
jgi:hypothetical protein